MVIQAAAKFDSKNENDEKKTNNINISKSYIFLLHFNILHSLIYKWNHIH